MNMAQVSALILPLKYTDKTVEMKNAYKSDSDYLMRIYADTKQDFQTINHILEEAAHQCNAFVTMSLSTNKVYLPKCKPITSIVWEIIVRKEKADSLLKTTDKLVSSYLLQRFYYPSNLHSTQQPTQMKFKLKNNFTICDSILYPIPPLLFSYDKIDSLSKENRTFLLARDEQYLCSAYCKQLSASLFNKENVKPTKMSLLNENNQTVKTISLEKSNLIEMCQRFVFTFFLCLQRNKKRLPPLPKFLKITILFHC